MDAVLKLFIYATAVAVVLQMVILAVLMLSVRKTSARLESLADELQRRGLPLLESAQAVLTDSRGKIETITANLASTTSTLKNQVERMDATVNDVVDRTRLQVIRADDMVSRAMDKVEETTDMVQHTVISPVRQMAGLMHGLSVGLGAFFGRNRRSPGRREHSRVTQDEELFI